MADDIAPDVTETETPEGTTTVEEQEPAPAEPTETAEDWLAKQPGFSEEDPPVKGESEPDPEEKPPVEAPAPEAEDPKPAEDAADKLPDDKPKRDDWKVLKGIHKEDRSTISDLQAKVKELEDAKQQPQAADPGTAEPPPVLPFEMPPAVTPPAPAPTPQYQPPPAQQPVQQQPAIPASTAAMALAKIAEGELEDTYRGEANQVLSNASPAELVGLLKQANLNEFGEYSDSVRQLASQYIPVAQANYAEKQADETAFNTFKAERTKAFEEVFAAVPALRQTESAEYKAFAVAANDLKTHIPSLQAIPRAPALVHTFMSLTTAAQGLEAAEKTATELRAENTELRKKLGLETSPQRPSVPISGSQQPDETAEEELARRLSALGVG